MLRTFIQRTCLCFVFLCPALMAAANPLDSALEIVNSVGPEGRGNEAASKAWRQLAQADTAQLITILEAMDPENELAANWLRAAVETIVDHRLSKGGTLPVADLGDFVLNTGNAPKARELAFDLVSRIQPEAAEALIPGFLHDPGNGLRRLAVARLIEEGAERKRHNPQSAAIVYRQALHGARDVDQTQAIAKALRQLDREVDLPRHFGFLMHWQVIGPFHNTDMKGFAEVFPPEQEIDLEAEYQGKNGKVRWTKLVTSDDYGMLDINKAYPGRLKEVTAYACTEFFSASARPAELRLGCKNAWKVWLNGEFLFGRDEYHRGRRIDQYRINAPLRAGKNTILVKVCQNKLVEDWTQEWEFQLRVCDNTGTAILSTQRPPTPTEDRVETAAH